MGKNLPAAKSVFDSIGQTGSFHLLRSKWCCAFWQGTPLYAIPGAVVHIHFIKYIITHYLVRRVATYTRCEAFALRLQLHLVNRVFRFSPDIPAIRYFGSYLSMVPFNLAAGLSNMPFPLLNLSSLHIFFPLLASPPPRQSVL